MTEPLNYSTKAIADLARLADAPALPFEDRQGVLFIQQLLQRAEVFVLPDAGELLDRSKSRPHIPGAVFNPPFPVVALEYRALPGSGTNHPIYEASCASKRIALAWHWDGRMPGNTTATHPVAGEGVVIASVCYMDEPAMWVPMMGAILIPYDCDYLRAEPTPAMKAFVQSGRITQQQADAEKIEVRAVLPIMSSAIARVAAEAGAKQMLSMLSADIMDEANAYIDLMTALACNNVGKMRVPQSAKLNKARIRSGKAPLKDFHVLTIAGAEYVPGTRSGATGASVRSHLRRGHIRRLGPERVTWVNSCMVRGSSPGFIEKQYAPQVAA